MLPHKKPEWLKKKVDMQSHRVMEQMLQELGLHTVCQSARCPNISECFQSRTATFMILGDVCTRNCSFCAVGQSKPAAVDPAEPRHILEASKRLNLRHIVITSVTRDDLPDGGAGQFAGCVDLLKSEMPNSTIELLIPDFKMNKPALDLVIKAQPTVINHNVETVPALYSAARPMASYKQSLDVLEYIKTQDGSIITKSGIMLGLGETKDEVVALISDLVSVRCDMLTIGQYLPPSKQHIELKEYITPEVFEELKCTAELLGIRYVAAGAYVRSSYNALEGIKLMVQT